MTLRVTEMKLYKFLAIVFFSIFAVPALAVQPGNFSFTDINGQYHRFSDYRGKWVIVNYWSTYCGPCISELPVLKAVAQRYRGKVEVLGMDAGETPVNELKQFSRQRGLNYTVVPTQDSTMFALGLIYGVPTTFIVSPQGQIVDTHMGIMSMERISQFVDARQPNARVASFR